MKKAAVFLRDGIPAALCAQLSGVWFMMALVIGKGPAAYYALPSGTGAFFAQVLGSASARDWSAGVCVALLLFVFFRALLRGRSAVLRFLYRYRWLLAGLLLVLCTALRINNTGLYAWTAHVGLHGAVGEKPLWGSYRVIRTDEWAVWSPFVLAQAEAGFPAVNGLIAGGGTDPAWISVGGIPAFSLAAIFKPFYWGFLLLGAEGGFSFLFACRTLGLFLVSLETARLYTRENLRLSFAAAVLLTLSPYVQWWFSQSIAEVLIFGQAMVLCLARGLRAKRPGLRLLWAAGLAWAFGCYAMVSYVSWLISGLYLLVPCAILILRRERGALRAKRDWPCLLPLAAVLGVLALLLWNSRDTLQRVMNSVYPGQRLITGGELRPGLLTGLFSLMLPFTDPVISNSSECAGFITFAPAGLLLALAGMIRRKKADPLAVILLAVEGVFWLFVLAGIPGWLAKITLLSQVNRPELVIGAADTVLLIRALALREKGFEPLPAAALALLSAAAGCWISASRYQPDLFTLLLMAGLSLLVGGCLFGFSRRGEAGARRAAALLVTAALMGGAFVNPLQRGLACVEDTALVQALKQVPDAPEDIWFTEAAWPRTNLPLMAGKRAVNSTQPYPAPDRWRPLDPDGAWEPVYNRFCHITAEVTEGETDFRLIAEDHMVLRVNGEGLRTLGVRYVLTLREYPAEYLGFFWEPVAEADGWRVYRLTEAGA